MKYIKIDNRKIELWQRGDDETTSGWIEYNNGYSVTNFIYYGDDEHRLAYGFDTVLTERQQKMLLKEVIKFRKENGIYKGVM